MRGRLRKTRGRLRITRASSRSTGSWRQAPATPVGDRGGARVGAPAGCAGARWMTHASLRRMHGGSRRDARGRRFRRSPQAAGGDRSGAGLGCGGGGGNWRRRREQVLGEAESRYLATAEELSWARRPLANHAAGRRRPLATRRRRAKEEDGAEGLV